MSSFSMSYKDFKRTMETTVTLVNVRCRALMKGFRESNPHDATGKD